MKRVSNHAACLADLAPQAYKSAVENAVKEGDKQAHRNSAYAAAVDATKHAEACQLWLQSFFYAVAATAAVALVVVVVVVVVDNRHMLRIDAEANCYDWRLQQRCNNDNIADDNNSNNDKSRTSTYGYFSFSSATAAMMSRASRTAVFRRDTTEQQQQNNNAVNVFLFLFVSSLSLSLFHLRCIYQNRSCDSMSQVMNEPS